MQVAGGFPGAVRPDIYGPGIYSDIPPPGHPPAGGTLNRPPPPPSRPPNAGGFSADISPTRPDAMPVS